MMSTLVLKDDPEDDSGPVTKKPKTSTSIVRGAQIRKKKSAGSNAGHFLTAFAETQAASQQRKIEHDKKMQQESAYFQQWLEQDHIKFETQLATILQQQNNQFLMNLMQENQLFQAELLKNLFEKILIIKDCNYYLANKCTFYLANNHYHLTEY